MRQAITDYLPWLMSIITITAIELQGRKWPRAWAISLAGQVFWFTWIAAAWDGPGKGFLPMALVLSFQYARNHLKWKREALDQLHLPAGISPPPETPPGRARIAQERSSTIVWGSAPRFPPLPVSKARWQAFIRAGQDDGK